MRGTVAHGAAFSKHFAAFTLAPECDDAPGTSAGDDGNAGSSSLVVDVVLNAKDGWDRDLLGDVCNALHLPGSPYASNPSPDTPTRPPRNVVVELIDFHRGEIGARRGRGGIPRGVLSPDAPPNEGTDEH